MGWAEGDRNLIFYTDDRRIGGRDHIWVQDALTVSEGMFQKLGLEMNLDKTNALVCTPGYIWREWIEAAYKRRATGEGGTFRERKRARVNCTVCKLTVETSSLKGHTEKNNGRSTPPTREVEIGGARGWGGEGGVPVTYVDSFPQVLKTVISLVTGCWEVAHSVSRMR